ncbi:MAG TPA: hypothetical protein VLL75_04560 [Vicinamibacteria bacterium]|nr:hypothetical protein [Vicinamibacteria bacterium]
MPVCSGARRRLVRLLAIAGLAAAVPAAVLAQVELLPPEILAKLDSASERPMALAPDGEPLRFRTGTERWEEAMPPGIVDVDRDGTKDYIVLILADSDSGRRALLARVWDDTPDAFGPTVFYVIIEDDDGVSEWAGSPRLAPLARPKP